MSCWTTHLSRLPPLLQRRKRQLKAREAGKVEAGHVSAGAAVLGMIASAGAEAAQTKVSKDESGVSTVKVV